MANRPIIGLQDTLPAGEFHLPVCIDSADLHELLSDLQYAAMRQGKTETPAWNRIMNALAYLDDPQNAPCNNCADYGGCQEVPALWSTVDYAPNDPRNPEEPTPPNYIDKPWYTIAPGTVSPYQPGDVVTDITKIPILANLPDLILNTGLPTITIHADGEGEVEIELLKIPAGGFCMITVDDNPMTAKFIPCNSLEIGSTGVWWVDVLNEVLEGDLFAAEKHEVRLEGSGPHVIRLVALPEIGGETLLGFGFGLRSVTYCGFPDVCEDCEDSMSCEDVLDCLDGVPAWEQLNAPPAEITMSPAEIQNLSDEQHEERDTQYDGTPDSILNDPVIDDVDRWGRNPAIDEALTAFVVACFEAKLAQMRQIEGLRLVANLILPFTRFLSYGGWLLNNDGWGFLSGTTYAQYGYDQLWDALQDEDNVRYTVQALRQSSLDTARRDINFANFQDLTTGGGNLWNQGDGAIIRDWMRDEILQHPLTAEKNYLLLLQAIHTANHHLEVFGDPMWDARNDTWVMNRGGDYSLVGVTMLDGSLSETNGFVARTAGNDRVWDILLTSNREFHINSFELTDIPGFPSPPYPAELTIKNSGATVYNNTRQWPIDPRIWTNLDAIATSVRWNATWQGLSDPSYLRRMIVNGSGKPPVGYWTPD